MVLDASVAVAWLLDDEDEPVAIVPLGTLEEQEALVPQLWHLEIRNALLAAERRGRIAPDQVAARLADLKTLPIHVDQEPDFDAAMGLARDHRLTFYDAMYLELAIRRDAQLATLDAALARAAAEEGLTPVSRRSPNVP